LTAKLHEALEDLNAGHTRAAIKQLHAFEKQVNALLRSHRLTAVEAQVLISGADLAIALAQK
jgi:hypothetical protein